MKHPTREEWMAYLYGELDGAKRAAVRRHLAECAECRGEVAVWRGAIEEMDKWPLAKGR